ncbi:MAG TPA: Rid family hydrolase [Acidimicrobiia bacterium]|jgi:enamine deaminase RidA (YjgF/YER057c/UK114 family)|nr:Rid family hydrolase [Acidimicrobiia bacterium]
MGLERYDPFDGALPFSLAVASGDTVHVSGMVGLDPETLTVPADIESQMRIAYRSIADALSQFSCTLADIADQTVFFVGDHEAAVAAGDAIRHELFQSGLSASTMVGVDKLVDPRFLVEIKVIAYRPGSAQ